METPDPQTNATIAELQAKLAARDKTIKVLVARVEGQIDRGVPGFSLMQENRALELAVEQKTAQLEQERAKLHDALQTLQRAQSELLQAGKLTAIGQLAAGIAHEINTPMQFVGDNTHFTQRAFGMLMPVLEQLRNMTAAESATPIGEAQVAELRALLKRAKLDMLCREVPKAIAGSLEGIKRVTNIVSAMKEFSHPSSGELRAENLNAAIESTIEVARNAWKYVADVQTELAPDLPAVPCLRDELNQVILNLIVNAADAIADTDDARAGHKGTVRVRTRRVDNWAEICVQDSGPGIPEHVRARVFEPFFTTKPVGKGTGQGLAIAYSVITDKHRGKIWFECHPGAGTAFYIRIPLEQTEGTT